MKTLYNNLDGYKTFIICLCGLIYGMGTGNVEVILASMAMAGFRDALNK